MKKSALTLLRKIVRYTTLNIVQALCEEGAPYSAQIVETIAYVLEVRCLQLFTCLVFSFGNVAYVFTAELMVSSEAFILLL